MHLSAAKFFVEPKKMRLRLLQKYDARKIYYGPIFPNYDVPQKKLWPNFEKPLSQKMPYQGRIRAVSEPYQGRIRAVSGPYQGRIRAVSEPYQGRIRTKTLKFAFSTQNCLFCSGMSWDVSTFHLVMTQKDAPPPDA